MDETVVGALQGERGAIRRTRDGLATEGTQQDAFNPEGSIHMPVQANDIFPPYRYPLGNCPRVERRTARISAEQATFPTGRTTR